MAVLRDLCGFFLDASLYCQHINRRLMSWTLDIERIIYTRATINNRQKHDNNNQEHIVLITRPLVRWSCQSSLCQGPM